MDKTLKVVGIKEIQSKLGSEVSVLDTQFPHISKIITSVWGDIVFYTFIQAITTTERRGREGFPLEVLTELTAIVDVHNELFPELVQEARVWLQE